MSNSGNKKPLWLVKLGGDVVADDDALAGLTADLALALDEGKEIVVVHGGGPQATRLMQALSMEPQFVGGRRVTDEATLEAVIKAVAGEVSTRLAAACTAASIPALAVTGVSAGLVQATKRPPRKVLGSDEAVDFGLVGDVSSIRRDRIRALIDAGFMPVIGCMASDGAGQVLNINGDVVAVDMAIALGAEKLFAVSGVPGVLRDPTDVQSRIETLNAPAVQAAVDDGTITGGMVAKVDEALRAVQQGVEEVFIVGPARRGLMADAIAGRAGTRVVLSS